MKTLYSERLSLDIVDSIYIRCTSIYGKANKHGCADCGCEHHWYMVKNELWDIAVPDYLEMEDRYFLCLFCLEKRIGRRLLISDFTDAPINFPIWFGYSLALEEMEDENWKPLSNLNFC